MIRNELEWHSELGYYVVEEKMRCSVSSVVKGGHGFGPFGEVIDSDNNVFLTIAGGGITSHKVNTHLQKGPAVMTG
jgi:hypothetical protein